MQTTFDNLGQAQDHRYDSRSNLVARSNAQGPLNARSFARRGLGSSASVTINDFGNVSRTFYDGINRTLQTYVMNSPLNFVDPMGLSSSWWNRDWGIFDHVIDISASFSEEMADQITGGRVSSANKWWSKEILGQEINYRQNKMAKKAGKLAGVAWQIAFALAGGGAMGSLQKLAKTNAYAKRVYQAILLESAGYGGAKIGTGIDMVSQGKTLSGTKMIASGVLTLLLALYAAEQMNSQEAGGGGSGGAAEAS